MNPITGDNLIDTLNQKRDIDLMAAGPVRVFYDAITQRFHVEGAGALGIATPDPHEAADAFNTAVKMR
jgi:hypothetical protein